MFDEPNSAYEIATIEGMVEATLYASYSATVDHLGVTGNPQVHVRDQGECGIGVSLGSPTRGRNSGDECRIEARQCLPRGSRDTHMAQG